jgi:hypothetical protein
MKKSFRKVVLVISLFSWAVGMSSHVVAANATGTATANVVHSLSIGAASDEPGASSATLAFGAFAGSAEGTVDIDPSTCNKASNVSHFGGHNCARFRVSGHNNAAYVISYESNQTLTHAEIPTATLPYMLELDNKDNRNRNLSGGSDEIQFGGSLTVAPDVPTGVYTGTFNVTIDYQ